MRRNNSLPKRQSHSGHQIRRRSDILRDSFALLSLAGYQPDQSSADDINLSHLAIPSVLTAFRIATQIEARRSRTALAKSGTLQKYGKIVQRLAVAHRRNDPYAEYRRKLEGSLWTSKSSREEARSALMRQASDHVIALSSLYVQLIFATVPEKSDRKTVLRAHKMLICRRLKHTPPLLGDSRLPFESCIELARACRFLSDQQRDKGPASVVATSSCTKRKTGKRPVLAALHRHQRTRRTASLHYDWRDDFWHQVRRDEYIGNVGMACIAALMITGCRPGEFAGESSMTVWANEGDAGPVLCCTMTGGKIFRPTEAGADQTEIVMPGIAKHPSDADRGQDWRRLTIACLAPEARWLHEYVRRYGSTEPAVTNDGKTEASAPFVSLKLYDPERRQNMEWLHPTERSRRAVVAFEKTVGRIGKVAFPKIKQAITPYVFRHALATDLRASGTHSQEAIAKALGHRSMRSMSAYGTRGPRNPGVRLHAVIDIAAPFEPRARSDSHDANLSQRRQGGVVVQRTARSL